MVESLHEGYVADSAFGESQEREVEVRRPSATRSLAVLPSCRPPPAACAVVRAAALTARRVRAAAPAACTHALAWCSRQSSSTGSPRSPMHDVEEQEQVPPAAPLLQ